MTFEETPARRRDAIVLQPIAIIRSCYPEKFGIPRQAGLVDKARATIELLSPYARPEMVRELDRFSHIWVQFLFHDTIAEGWKATVRPPGLGGRTKVGVFASRSPHRPNHIGLSAVRLLKITKRAGAIHIVVSGGDFLDGTPVIDIKPYIAYSDSVPDAGGAYSGRSTSGIEVCFEDGAEAFCRLYEKTCGRDLRGLICQVLRQDPRPASQRTTRHGFGFRLWDINIRWKAEGELFTVTECRTVSGEKAGEGFRE